MEKEYKEGGAARKGETLRRDMGGWDTKGKESKYQKRET